MPNTLKYIKVNAVLKQTQKIDYNKWACHINGEAKVFPSNHIQANALSMGTAAMVFDPEECDKITIEYNG